MFASAPNFSTPYSSKLITESTSIRNSHSSSLRKQFLDVVTSSRHQHTYIKSVK